MKPLAALILLCAASASAAEISINAEVDKAAVALDDQITLNVTVSGSDASLPEPQLPQMPNFSVYSRGRSQSISFINGQVESSIVHTFVLVPRFVGRGTIPPIVARAGAQTLATQPIEIVVEKPGAAGGPHAMPGMPGAAASGSSPSRPPSGSPSASRGPDLFVTAQIDNPRPFVNEAVTLVVRFHTAVNLLGNPQYVPPKLTGFLAEDLPPERHGRVNARGRQYYYSEIRTALFPAQVGRLTIGAAAVRAQVQVNAAVDPFAPDFFDRFFSGGMAAAQTRELSSDPIVLDVQPLPEAGKPKDFSGAVGRFSISAAVDRSQVKAGDAVNLTLTVAGAGNFKALAQPPLPELESFRVFETVSSLNLDKKDGRVEGSKVFKTVVVPRVSGDLTIPPVSFSYFDPRKRAYASAQTPPIKIKVAPGDAAAAVGFAAPAAPGARGLSAVTQDIRYLKLRAPRRPLGRALEAIAGAGALHAVPFAAFALFFGAAQYRKLEERDPARRRRRLALKTALEKAAAGAPAEALHGYLADVLGRPAGSLTARKAQEEVRAFRPSVPQELLGELKDVWEELDRLRFAPGAAGAAAAGERVNALLRRLEEALK